MRLTTKGRYAVTAMLDLALHSQSGPVSLAEISGRQEISLSYLEQLFSKLRKRELVRSVRGPGGGYCLQRPSEDVFIAEIVDAVDERVDATNCRGKSDCQDGAVCLTHCLWSDLSEHIRSFLQGISLAELIQRQEVRTVSARQHHRLAALGGRSNDGDELFVATLDS